MEKMLITKIKRTDETRADLYGKGHKWPDLKLFDIGELLAVGITPDELPIGVEKPCRFLAHFTLSDKLNEAGNPYRDISHLEPVDNGAGNADPAPMNDAMLAAILKELRAQTALLQVLAQAVGGEPQRPEPYIETGPQEAPPEEEPEEGNGSDLDQWFTDNTPTSPKALLEYLADQDLAYSSIRSLFDTLASHYGDEWVGWPQPGDLDGWNAIQKAALELAEA